MFPYIILMGILTTAVYQDFKSYQVSNKWILFGYFCGFLCMGIQSGGNGIFHGFIGMMVPIALLWCLWKIGAFGGGDIKLFSVSGVFLGGKEVLFLIWYSLLAGCLISILKIVCVSWGKLIHLYSKSKNSFVADLPVKNPIATKITKQNKLVIHYSLAILFGMAAWLIRAFLKGGMW